MKRDMRWEWNWPHKLIASSRGVSFDLSLMSGDHAPGFYCCLIVGAWALLDFGYYNRNHAED